MCDPSKNPYDRQHLIVAYRRGYEQALKDRALTEQEREVFNTVMSFFSESESEFLFLIKKKVLGEQ